MIQSVRSEGRRSGRNYGRSDLFGRGMFRIERNGSDCTEGEMVEPFGEPTAATTWYWPILMGCPSAPCFGGDHRSARGVKPADVGEPSGPEGVDEEEIFNRDCDVKTRRRPHLRAGELARPRDRWPAS